MLLVLLLFLDALAFIFWVTPSFSLPVFSFSFLGSRRRVQHGQYSVVVLRRSAWSRNSLFGPTALFCGARVSADASVNWHRVLARVLHLSSHVHCFSARSIEERFISQSSTLLLVGRAGWLHMQRRQNHLPAPPARTAPLRFSPHRLPPADSSHESYERRNIFQDFCISA